MYQGGNMWAGYDSYLTAMRDVLGLLIPEHEKYVAWEDCATKAGGFRMMHEEFCIVSDYPETLKIDDQNRPHCEDGPSHRWRDGWSLWHIHGVVVPEWIVLRPEQITVAKIDAEKNIEVRRIMQERMGVGKYLHESGAQLIDFDQVEVVRGSGKMMPRALLKARDGAMYLEGTDSSTTRSYFMRVPPSSKTCRDAHNAIAGLDESRCVGQS
jgi:hypothetical protein